MLNWNRESSEQFVFFNSFFVLLLFRSFIHSLFLCFVSSACRDRSRVFIYIRRFFIISVVVALFLFAELFFFAVAAAFSFQKYMEVLTHLHGKYMILLQHILYAIFPMLLLVVFLPQFFFFSLSFLCNNIVCNC